MAKVVNPQRPTKGRSDFGQNVRETISALIGLAIAAIALWMLCDTYLAGKAQPFDKDVYGRQKDILLLALGFLGTVTGYYLGRAPAERQADAARSEAKAARQSEARIKDHVQAGLSAIERQHDALGGSSTDPVNAEIARLRASL